MKVDRFTDGVLCYVAKLNRSSAALPQAVLEDRGTVNIKLQKNRVCDITLLYWLKINVPVKVLINTIPSQENCAMSLSF